jgi:hypothetical protein
MAARWPINGCVEKSACLCVLALDLRQIGVGFGIRWRDLPWTPCQVNTILPTQPLTRKGGDGGQDPSAYTQFPHHLFRAGWCGQQCRSTADRREQDDA